MQNRVARSGLGSACLLMLGGLGVLARGQGTAEGPSSVIRDGFETPKVAWRQERTDATVKIFAHERTNRAAHEGVLSEGFQFEAGIGGGLYYSYSLPKVPVTDELKVGLFVRSNRSGVQILGRVVLPADVDPDSRQPTYVLVAGTIFESSDRWQRLELADMLPEIERQARVLRASARRKISLEGAYLERLIVNIYGGEGETEVYLDELSVGPVTPEVAEAAGRKARGDSPAPGPSARTIADRPRAPSEPLEAVRPGLNTRIKFDRNRLTKDGYPWFFTAVRAPDVDPAQLRRLGCDVQVVPEGADEEWIKASVQAGLLLMPELTGPSDRKMPEGDQLAAKAATFPFRDDVAFWSLGENLGRANDIGRRKETLRRVRDAVRELRKVKPGGSPFATGTALGMLPEYSRVPENLDLVGVPTAGWATMQDPWEFYKYLEQRRLLTARSNADALLWAMLDATPPPVYQESIWGADAPPAWGLPRVQPEQLRTATYAAIAAGFRGICFRADSGLNRAQGRMNMIEMALLNEEIDLLEPILGDPDKAIRMIETYLPDAPPPPPVTLFQMNSGTANRPATPKELPPHPSIRAAAITTKDRRGTLLMLADFTRDDDKAQAAPPQAFGPVSIKPGHAKYSQYQPPQSAANKVKLIVPGSADSHAYLITPGGVEALDSRIGPGGHHIFLEDFGVTAIVLVTTNVELKDQVERSINANRSHAASLAIEQAEMQLAWVTEIDGELQVRGHPQRDSATLLNQANELIKSARENHERESYQTAWDEARRAGRPLRILMRAHFLAAYDEIVRVLNDEDLPCGPVAYEGQKKPKPRIIGPIVAAPLASFNTLPQAWIWADWIRTGRLGRNLLPGGDFNDPDVLKDGWADDGYKSDEIETSIRIQKGGPDQTRDGTNLAMFARPRKGLTIDSLPPFADHPLVAIRSPEVKVGARQVYRISVMAYMGLPTAPGAGGLIVRDSIGGERLQFRSSSALTEWYEIVYYRRVPADGTLSVTLGMAGYNSCAFDDLRIEPIVEQVESDAGQVSVRPRRRPARPSTEAEPPATDEAPTRPTTATRPRPVPIRQ